MLPLHVGPEPLRRGEHGRAHLAQEHLAIVVVEVVDVADLVDVVVEGGEGAEGLAAVVAAEAHAGEGQAVHCCVLKKM